MDIKNMLFWTERVYLDGDDTSSKDPLGTEAFAGHLADLILPGMTTITWRVRYVTLICQWIDFINNKLGVKGVDEVINRILQIEKLAAFSMLTVPEWGSSNMNDSVSEDDERDDVNLRRLIGKRYARAFKTRATPFSLDKKDYPFLMNHKAAGAYSVYKVLLMSLGLLDEDTVCLTEKGKDFLEGIALPVKTPSFIRGAIAGEDIDIKCDSFKTLGEYWGLANFSSKTERKRLKVLMLSEHRRRSTLEVLRDYKKNNGHYEVISDIAEKSKGAKNVVDVFKYIQNFERVNREVHFLFYSLLSTGADQISIDELFEDAEVKKSFTVLTSGSMNDYLDYHAKNEQMFLDGKWVPDDQLFSFYRDLYESKGNPHKVFEKIIIYHRANQKRKSKRPWVDDFKDGKCIILLHRYKNESGNPYGGRDGVVHNYRLNNAWSMIDDLGI
jgi:hypothetical protein